MNEQIYEAEVCLPTIIKANGIEIDKIIFEDNSEICRHKLELHGKKIVVKKLCSTVYDYITCCDEANLSKELLFKCEWLRNIRPLIPKRWMAEYGGAYYAVNSFGEVNCMKECYSRTDNFRYTSHNYYKTREEAQHALDLQTIENELVALIEELNAGRKLDWTRNNSPIKYYLRYDFDYNKIRNISHETLKDVSDKFCCLDEDLREKAIQRIGQDRLEMYLRER